MPQSEACRLSAAAVEAGEGSAGSGRVGRKSKEGDVGTWMRFGCAREDVGWVTGMPAYSGVGDWRREGMLNAPGWSENCCIRVPSSRAMRPRRRFSQPGSEEAFNVSVFERDVEGLEADSLLLFVCRDSPNIMASIESSMPMKSRMTRLVRRCKKVSFSKIRGVFESAVA